MATVNFPAKGRTTKKIYGGVFVDCILKRYTEFQKDGARYVASNDKLSEIVSEFEDTAASIVITDLDSPSTVPFILLKEQGWTQVFDNDISLPIDVALQLSQHSRESDLPLSCSSLAISALLAAGYDIGGLVEAVFLEYFQRPSDIGGRKFLTDLLSAAPEDVERALGIIMISDEFLAQGVALSEQRGATFLRLIRHANLFRQPLHVDDRYRARALEPGRSGVVNFLAGWLEEEVEGAGSFRWMEGVSALVVDLPRGHWRCKIDKVPGRSPHMVVGFRVSGPVQNQLQSDQGNCIVLDFRMTREGAVVIELEADGIIDRKKTGDHRDLSICIRSFSFAELNDSSSVTDDVSFKKEEA